MATTDHVFLRAWIRGRWDRLLYKYEVPEALELLVKQAADFSRTNAQEIQHILKRMQDDGEI